MKDDLRPAWRGYLIAVVTVLLTTLVWVASTTLIGNRVSSSFFLMGIVVASRFGGYGPAWLALVLGAIPVTYSQYTRLGLSDPACAAIIIVYFGLGTILTVVMQSERTSRRNAERSAFEALEKQRLFENEIADRKEAEQKLRTKESQLRGIMDNALAVIYLKDLQGRYVLINRRYQLLFRHQNDDLVGKTDLEWFPEPIARAFMESDQKVMHEQTPLVVEEVALHDDGPHTYRSVKFPVKDDAGNMIALGGVSTDISDLKAAHESLKKQEALLRNLIEVQENEKQFLCHEFHDGLIQYAVGSMMLLEGFLSTHQGLEDSATLETIIGSLRKGIEDGRRVIRGIRPAVLDDSDLKAAIDDLIGQFSTSGIHVTSRCDPQIGRLPDLIQTTIYRVVQEALNNAKKYSGTDTVRIELTQANGDLRLEVRDFGCGFDVPSARTRSFGLVGMTERVRVLGGECDIQSELGEGTRISVRLPLPVAEDES
jgi:PAS domain S-box-containing protein